MNIFRWTQGKTVYGPINYKHSAYHKTPYINLWAYTIQRAFLMG